MGGRAEVGPGVGGGLQPMHDRRGDPRRGPWRAASLCVRVALVVLAACGTGRDKDAGSDTDALDSADDGSRDPAQLGFTGPRIHIVGGAARISRPDVRARIVVGAPQPMGAATGESTSLRLGAVPPSLP